MLVSPTAVTDWFAERNAEQFAPTISASAVVVELYAMRRSVVFHVAEMKGT